MSSCFGFRKSKGEDTEALLPQYADDTSLQRSLHQKMHTYQMIVQFPPPLFPNEFLMRDTESPISWFHAVYGAADHQSAYSPSIGFS